MAVFRPVHIALPEAELFIDYTGVECDLRKVIDYIVAVEKRAPFGANDDETGAVFDALATAVPVRYARCFANGARRNIDISEAGLSEREHQCHAFWMSYRNMHAAHSINGYEHGRIRANLNPEERGGRRVNSLSVETHILVAPAVERFTELAALIRDRVLPFVQKRLHAEEVRLRGIVESRFTLDELYALDASPPPDFGRVDKGRPRQPR